MSRCILFGHSMSPMRGAGQYRNEMYAVCADCGKTQPMGPVAENEMAPILPNAFVRLESPPKAANGNG